MSHYPTRRHIGTPTADENREWSRRSEAANIPWLDTHQHTHTLSWNDREVFELTGAKALVAIAASYYWAPYRPVEPDDVRFLWDDALRRASRISDSHFFE